MKSFVILAVLALATLTQAQKTITVKVLSVTTLYADGIGFTSDHFYDGYLITFQHAGHLVSASCETDNWLENGAWLTYTFGEIGQRKGLIRCVSAFHVGQQLTFKVLSNGRLLPVSWAGITGSWEPTSDEAHRAGYVVVSE
jgi:hypothetical protein